MLIDFCIQAGFSVGFGADEVTCEDSNNPTACRWYTTFHILVGSSFVATALGLWAGVLVQVEGEKSTSRRQERVRRAANPEPASDADSERSKVDHPIERLSLARPSQVDLPSFEGHADNKHAHFVASRLVLARSSLTGNLLPIGVFLTFVTIGVTFGMVRCYS